MIIHDKQTRRLLRTKHNRRQLDKLKLIPVNDNDNIDNNLPVPDVEDLKSQQQQ